MNRRRKAVRRAREATFIKFIWHESKVYIECSILKTFAEHPKDAPPQKQN